MPLSLQDSHVQGCPCPLAHPSSGFGTFETCTPTAKISRFWETIRSDVPTVKMARMTHFGSKGERFPFMSLHHLVRYVGEGTGAKHAWSLHDRLHPVDQPRSQHARVIIIRTNVIWRVARP